MFLLYVQANSVNNTKGNKGDNSGLALDFTMKELYAIEEIQSEENLFRLLVA
jgi:DNA helicase MCM8